MAPVYGTETRRQVREEPWSIPDPCVQRHARPFAPGESRGVCARGRRRTPPGVVVRDMSASPLRDGFVIYPACRRLCALRARVSSGMAASFRRVVTKDFSGISRAPPCPTSLCPEAIRLRDAPLRDDINPTSPGPSSSALEHLSQLPWKTLLLQIPRGPRESHVRKALLL